MQNFTSYLQTQHALTGDKDFPTWLSNLDGEQYIRFARMWGKQVFEDGRDFERRLLANKD